MHSQLETYERVPAFLYKLWKLVEDSSTDHLIRWQDDGRSFILCNQGEFARELLPLYYKHNNMASFVRQLNMYGFRKVPSMEGGGLRMDKDEMEFTHPFFVRGEENKLELIKRKMNSSRLPNSMSNYEVSLMAEVARLQEKQDNMMAQMTALRREHSSLWGRYCEVDERLKMQNNIIEKLSRFVMSLVKPKSMRMAVHLPQLQALFNSRAVIPALTHKSSSSPFSEGPVIHEVVDDVITNEGVQGLVTSPLSIGSPATSNMQPATVMDKVAATSFQPQVKTSDIFSMPQNVAVIGEVTSPFVMPKGTGVAVVGEGRNQASVIGESASDLSNIYYQTKAELISSDEQSQIGVMNHNIYPQKLVYSRGVPIKSENRSADLDSLSAMDEGSAVGDFVLSLPSENIVSTELDDIISDSSSVSSTQALNSSASLASYNMLADTSASSDMSKPTTATFVQPGTVSSLVGSFAKGNNTKNIITSQAVLNSSNVKTIPKLTFTLGPGKKLIPTKDTQVFLNSRNPTMPSNTSLSGPASRFVRSPRVVANVNVVPSPVAKSSSSLANVLQTSIPVSANNSASVQVTSVAVPSRAVQTVVTSNLGGASGNRNINPTVSSQNFKKIFPEQSSKSSDSTSKSFVKRRRENDNYAMPAPSENIPIFRVVKKRPQQNTLVEYSNFNNDEMTVVKTNMPFIDSGSTSTGIYSDTRSNSTAVVPVSGTPSRLSSGKRYPSTEEVDQHLQEMQKEMDDLMEKLQSGQIELDSNRLSQFLNTLPEFDSYSGAMPVDDKNDDAGNSVEQSKQQVALYYPQNTDLASLIESPSRATLEPQDETLFGPLIEDSCLGTPYSDNSPSERHLDRQSSSLNTPKILDDICDNI